jgi:hypothetical protein
MDNECESLVALADRLVALAEAATAGPLMDDGSDVVIVDDDGQVTIIACLYVADTRLIVAAVNALPVLAAGIHHLHERAEKAEAVCRSIDDCSYDPIAMAAWREVAE